MILPINIKAIKSSFSKYRIALIEFTINIFSFSLLMLAQQLIALPIISRSYEINEFGKIIIAFGISNIITSMFGFSIGNARFLDDRVYNQLYLRMIKLSSIAIALVSTVIYILFFPGDYLNSIVYSIVCVIGNIRYFILSEYRLRDEHNWIFKQNLYYFSGILVGLIIFYFFNNWLVVFLLAEIVSISFSFYQLRKRKLWNLFNDNSSLPLTNTIHLILNNGASYTLMYYDRFIIYPILGAANVSVYFSASTTSKIGGFIINPLSNYILGKLATKREEDSYTIFKLSILGTIFMIFVYFVLSVVTTPILVAILYPDFLSKVIDVFIPICFGAAVMGGVNILKPIIMKYMGAKYYNKLFLLYGILLIILSVLLCIKYNLLGIAIANVISSIILFVSLLIGFKRHIQHITG